MQVRCCPVVRVPATRRVSKDFIKIEKRQLGGFEDYAPLKTFEGTHSRQTGQTSLYHIFFCIFPSLKCSFCDFPFLNCLFFAISPFSSVHFCNFSFLKGLFFAVSPFSSVRFCNIPFLNCSFLHFPLSQVFFPSTRHRHLASQNENNHASTPHVQLSPRKYTFQTFEKRFITFHPSIHG